MCLSVFLGVFKHPAVKHITSIIRRKHYLNCQGKSRCLTGSIPRPLTLLPTDYKSGGLIECITELRKAFHFLSLVYYKGHNSGTARWTSTQGEVWGPGGAPMPSGAPPSQYLTVFTSPEALEHCRCAGFCGGFTHGKVDSITGHW